MHKFSKRLLSVCGSLMMLSALTAGLPAYAEETSEAAEAAETAEPADTAKPADIAEPADTEDSEDAADFAETASEDDNTFIEDGIGYRYLEDGKSVAVSRIDETLTEVEVPKTAKGKPVTRVDEGAFSQCSALKSVKLPDSVTEIAAGAFYYCIALENVNIPDSVTQLGDYAFANCYALRELKLPPHITAIPANAFYYNIGLEEITIPDGVTSIGTQSFVYCYSLRKLHIPASVTEIADLAIVSCMGLSEFDLDPANTTFTVNEDGALMTADKHRIIAVPVGKEDETYTVPEGVTSIAPYAFSGALKLKTITLPDSITELGDGAFSDCQVLESVTVPQKITAIPACLFAGCTSLQSFAIPQGVTSIAESAFYGCEKLTEMIIPETVTEIRAWAFYGCSGLSGMRIPDSVTAIGDNAIGFTIANTGDASSSESVVQSGFLLEGGADSAAKDYAEKNGIAFKQTGLSKTALIGIVGGALVLLLAIAMAVLMKKGKKAASETADVVGEPEEPVSDPNYTSILEEDDENDPYDRSYGLQTEEPEEDAAEDPE